MVERHVCKSNVSSLFISVVMATIPYDDDLTPLSLLHWRLTVCYRVQVRHFLFFVMVDLGLRFPFYCSQFPHDPTMHLLPTAIGEKNMLPFQTFVCLVFICLIVDIFLITGAM
jgi:hypothetical protein